ncbi:MAG: DUF4097 family beta strand repeat-containing protein [Fimbriimonas sp.]
MKEEIKRITQMVSDGKLSPEDAAELIQAFYANDPQPKAEERDPNGPPPPPPGAVKDPFRSILDTIERIGREATSSVNWEDVSKTAKEGAKKGAEAVKTAIDEIGKGRINLGWLLNTETREVTLPLSVGTGKTLRIENPNGDVRVVGGNDIGSVRAVATFKGATAEEARNRADSYTLILEESDHAVTVRQPEIAGLSATLEVLVATGTPVDIRTESGNLDVIATGAGLRIHGRSGNIRAQGLNGLVEIDAVSGNVLLEDCQSPSLSVESKSGNLNVERFQGNLNGRIASGSVRLNAISGKTVSVEAVSGDIEVVMAEAFSGSLNLRTVSGHASVTVPTGGDYRVSLSTLRGLVQCNLELDDEIRSEQRVTGRVGDGVGTLDVSAVTGDVSVVHSDGAEA